MTWRALNHMHCPLSNLDCCLTVTLEKLDTCGAKYDKNNDRTACLKGCFKNRQFDLKCPYVEISRPSN